MLACALKRRRSMAGATVWYRANANTYLHVGDLCHVPGRQVAIDNTLDEHELRWRTFGDSGGY